MTERPSTILHQREASRQPSPIKQRPSTIIHQKERSSTAIHTPQTHCLPPSPRPQLPHDARHARYRDHNSNTYFSLTSASFTSLVETGILKVSRLPIHSLLYPLPPPRLHSPPSPPAYIPSLPSSNEVQTRNKVVSTLAPARPRARALV